MTISSDDRIAGPFNGTGAQTAFPFAFKVFSKADLLVITADADGLETTLVLDSDYSVALNADQDANPGGTITYPISGTALPVGETLTATTNVANLQPTDITNAGGFYPQVVEDALDRNVVLIQQVAQAVDRALQVSVSTPADVDVVLPPPEAQKVIGWNDSGTGLVNRDITDFATVVAFAAWQSQTFDGDGTTTAFTLSSDPGNINNLDIAIGGVTQTPLIDFTLSGTTLTFTSAPPVGTDNVFVRWGQALPQGAAQAVNVSMVDAGGYYAGTTVELALQEIGARAVISVKDPRFGATGDGTTDDTAAFDAATAYIKAVTVLTTKTPPELYVPDGIYNIDRILIQHNDFHLRCSPGAVFKWRGGAGSTYPYFIYPDNLASVIFDEFYKNIVIEGFRIDPATIATGKSAIRIGNMYQGVIRDSHIEDDTFAADATKLALDFGNGSYKWAVENCTMPRMRCEATTAWNVTTIAFRSVGGRRLALKNALGITAHGLVLEGDEVTDKIHIEACNGVSIFGGDFEGAGTLYNFIGANNTNFQAFGNDTTALTGGYSAGTAPAASFFNDKGYPGWGFPNSAGTAAYAIFRRADPGRVLRLDGQTGTLGANLCVDINSSGYVLVGPADDRLLRLGPVAGNPGLSVQDNKLGFYSTSPIAKPAVTGSRGGNAALQSLLTQLAALGLITDSSSA